MIIACPACNTRYVVPDSAIGAEGRTVRCAKCKHSWFQDGPELEMPDTSVAAAPEAAPRPVRDGPAAPRPAAAAVPVPDVSPAPEPSFGTFAKDTDEIDDGERAPDFDEVDPPYRDLPADRDEDDVGPDAVDPHEDENGSRFDYAPPFRPRRNWVRLWTWAAAIFAVLAIGAVAAVSYLGVPDWVPVQRPLFALAEPDLKLEFPVEEQERRTLANGTEFFGARIIVTNEARESRDVPPILIVLRDARERIVYSWEVVPPQSSLTPGETMTINEAITDVPKAAVFADIGWAPR